MTNVLITFAKVHKGNYGLSVENLHQFLEENGEVGKLCLIECLDSILKHLRYGPLLLPAPEVIQ